jgi:hypothetical protein
MLTASPKNPHPVKTLSMRERRSASSGVNPAHYGVPCMSIHIRRRRLKRPSTTAHNTPAFRCSSDANMPNHPAIKPRPRISALSRRNGACRSRKEHRADCFFFRRCGGLYKAYVSIYTIFCWNQMHDHNSTAGATLQVRLPSSQTGRAWSLRRMNGLIKREAQ